MRKPQDRKATILTAFRTAGTPIHTNAANTGAAWQDSQVVCDQAFVTPRTPDGLSAFCGRPIADIGEGRHEGRAA